MDVPPSEGSATEIAWMVAGANRSSNVSTDNVRRHFRPPKYLALLRRGIRTGHDQRMMIAS
jgi:hypothetical protein